MDLLGPTGPLGAYGQMAIYLGVSLALVVILSILPGLLGPKAPSAAKSKPYECGVSEPQPIQTRWPVRFALVAMLFLIFDVEGLFFYPWAVVVRDPVVGQWRGLLAMGSFFAVLGVGYIYARGRGALKWR
jgi:NADH-quinone oxidoreductase subunit A